MNDLVSNLTRPSVSSTQISLDLWACGSFSWFMQTHLPSQAEEWVPAHWAQQLEAQLQCNSATMAGRLHQLSLAELDLPFSLQRLVAQESLHKAQLFVLALCDALNNHYELNIALQQLQGAHQPPWPRLYLLCDLVQAICACKVTPTEMAQWPWVQTGVLQLQTNGPLALAWVQLNNLYWRALQSSQQLFTFLTPVNKAEGKNLSQTLPVLARYESVDLAACSDFAVAMRMGKVRQLHLCGSRCAALDWAQTLAVCLNKILVFPAANCDANFLALLYAAHELLPIVSAQDSGGVAQEVNIGLAVTTDLTGDFNGNANSKLSAHITPTIVLHQSPLSVAELAQLQQQTAVAIYHLPVSARQERLAAWQAWAPAQADEFARRWLIAPDAIHPLAASVSPGVWQKPTVDVCDAIAQARRQLAPGHLQNLAFLVPQQVAEDALVLSPKIHAELHALQIRCEQREQVFCNLGPAMAGAGHGGVKALLFGESGTGKTLAALYLASRLTAPLYRLDLGAVLNKYVGETEKNIHQLMLEAAAGDFILLIDEADALFAKRGDGDSGGERFANMLTNYLLARIEQHPGIVLMTTNGLGRIDSAFMRRFDRVIEFHPPTMDERVRLWQNHLGVRSPGEQACKQLASLCDLSGGFIRNAVLAAAAELPASEQPRLNFARLLQAIAREYRKSGKPLPPKLLNQLNQVQPDQLPLDKAVLS